MKQNKNKIFFFTIVTLLTVFLAFSFTGCVPPVPEIIEVTGVEIADDDQSMKVDETLQLTTVVTPEDATNKAITWQSDNPDVAIVDENGLVTALKKGVANITVITEDGAFANTIKITVTKPYVPSPPTIKKYEVSFQVIDGIPAGINSRNSISIDLSGFKIEIFKDTERTIIVKTTTTDSNGAATVELPDGEYWFRVSKEGYADYPPEASFSIERLTPPGYFKIEGADVTDPIQVPMEPVYTVTFDKNNPNATDATPTTAEVTSGDSLGVLPGPPSLPCHTFLGWATTADKKNSDFDENTIITDNITVYAVWTERILLYSNGTEYVDFVEGYTSAGWVSKEENYLRLRTWANINDEIAYVTNEPIDLTNIEKIEIVWENTGYSGSESYLIISPNKDSSYQEIISPDFIGAYLNLSGNFVGQWFELDLSELDHNYDYFIRVHVRPTSTNLTGKVNLDVYQIRLICSAAGA